MNFNLPQQYIKNKPLTKGNFIKGLCINDRERFETTVKGIILEYQIEGEKIPSLLNENYNVQVIMFIKVNIDNLKNAAFIAGIMQEKIKGYAVITITDNMENSVLSFALKRLNENDKNGIIITEKFLSEPYSETLSSEFKNFLEAHLVFEKILNTSNKYTFYFEIMAKCFIRSNKYLYKDYLNLVESKLWYNIDKCTAVFESLKNLEIKKIELKRATEITEQIKINVKIKKLNEELKKYGE